MLRKFCIINTCGREDCGNHQQDHEHGAYYLVQDVDAVLKRQASAAIAGMHAATAISSGQLQQAHRLRAESNPEALESERQANALLTARIAELEADLETLARSGCKVRSYNGERYVEIASCSTD
jgi:hypothetical protein